MESKTKQGQLGQLLILATAFFFLYYQAIRELIYDWTTDPNFSHGFLIPFVAIYMVWYQQNKLRNLSAQPAKTGLLVVLFGMLVHLLGHVGSELFLMRFSMIITLSGIIIYTYGYKIFKVVLIPVSYLIMMIPIPSILWNKLAFPLQLLSAKMSAITIGLLRIPVFREGNILHLSNTSLEVVDACSGIRSLTSLLALTGVFAFLAQLSRGKKILLFLSAIPIAVFVNVLRLTLTGAMAAWISPETAHGFLHDMSGLVVFGTALIIVYGVYLLGIKIEKLGY